MTKSQARRAEINANVMREHYERRSREAAVKAAKEAAISTAKQTAPALDRVTTLVEVEGVTGLIPVFSWVVRVADEARAFGDEREARDYYNSVRAEIAEERSRNALITRLTQAKRRAIALLKTEVDFAAALSDGVVTEEAEEAIEELREMIALLS